MPFFGMNPVEDQNATDAAVQNPYIAPQETPGFFDNAAGAVGTSLEKSVLSATNAVYDTADPILKNTLNPDDSAAFEQFRSDVKDLIVHKQIDPTTTGALGKVGGMVAGGALTAAYGAAGGPAGVAAAFGVTGYKDTKLELQSQGVDDTTATEAALPVGIQQAAMGFLPFGVGNTVLQRAGAGILGNIAIGAASRKTSGAVLESHGYHALAQQYKPLDGMSVLADGVLGGFIGVGHAPGEPINADITGEQKQANLNSLAPSDVDASLAMNSIAQHEIDSAPGIPADIESRNAHTDMMDQNAANVLAGEQLDVPDSMLDAKFLPKPEAPEITQAFEDAKTENGIDETPVPEDEAIAQTPLNAGDELPSSEETQPTEQEPSKSTEAPRDAEATDTDNQASETGEAKVNDETPAQEGGAEDYHTQLARDIIAENPDTQVPTGFTKDEENNDVLQSVSGDEALKQAEDEAARNDELDNMVQAAINCSLRFGGLE